MHRISSFVVCCVALAFLFLAGGSTKAATVQTACCVDRSGPRTDTKEPPPKLDKPKRPEKPDPPRCCVDRREPPKSDKPEQHHSQ